MAPDNQRSLTDFVVISSDLQLYVLDTQVKRGAELSTDLDLVVDESDSMGASRTNVVNPNSE